ncbi:surface anchored protein [Streptococcus pneumoniae]|nr:surface anchored protein [Streptococcus pneumoniae]
MTDFARTNNAPEVKIPYSVDGKKDVYVYANEDFDIPVKFTDDSGKIASATINRGGNVEQPAKDAANPNVLDNEYESTVEKISTETTATEANPAVVHIKGNYSKATPGLAANKFPTDENGEFPIVTRYATATDTDGKDISNHATGSSYATDPGSFRIVLKAQTAKYDVKELDDANKTVVSNTATLTPEDLATVKENLQLEYSKKNKDKNINKDEVVTPENVKKAVDTVKQDGDNLVVTYKDGSKDTIPVDKVAKLDKQPAIDAVTNKATDQIAAINGNDNLTQAEKDKAIADVTAGKDAALEKIADATNSTAITTAQTDGTGAVAKVNPIGKEKAKEEIAKTLEAKKEAIENNDSLTQAEKEKAKKDAEDKAAAALAEIEKQPATAETAAAATAAQTTVNDKQAEGTKEVAKINPIGKQAALDKIDEALKAKEAEMDARTDLTEEEKAEAKAEAKKFADDKKAEIKAKNDNADTEAEAETIQGEIDTAGDTGKTQVEGVTKPAAKKPEAKTAVETTAAAKKQEIEQDGALSPEAKKKLQDEVDAVKKASEEAIDGAKKNDDVAKAKKSAEAAIKAINSARLPANKVIAEDPTNLKPEEQEKLKKAIEAVNPPGTKVVVKDDGSAEVTLPGKQAPETLKQEDLTKSEADLEKDGGGNNINRPTDKVIVGNPESLTDADKENIKKAVREVNPNAVVTIDDNGTVTVSTPEGNTAGFTAKELVRTLADAAKDDSGNAGVRKPADKLVGDATNADLQAKATEKLKKLNGEDAKVKYDDEGNATVVLKDGTIATIPAGDLFKTEEDAKKANGGDDINKPNAQTVVEDIAALSPEERTKVKDVIKAKVEAVNPGAVVVVDDQGNAVVTTPAGKTAVIDADDLIKKPNETSTAKAGNNINNPADRVRVDNSKQLTDPELARIKAAVEAVNPGAEVVVDDQGNATVTTPEGKTAVIPAADLTKSSDAEKAPKAGNDIVKPASKTKVANPDSLTKDEKDAIAAKVAAVNPGSTVVVDDQGNATVTLPNGNTAVIPASDLTKSEKDVNDGKAKDNAVTPASKTKVANPNALTEAEKKAIEDKVKAANPGAEVVVDDKGNATVVKDGNVSVIPSTDLVKVEDDAKKDNGGNDANTPAAKTVVADSTKLTDKEKEAVKKAVEAVNPASTVVVDDQGNATVTKGDGTVLNIPASDLVIPAEKLADEAKNAKVKTPAIRTLVGNKENLTKDEKDAVKKSIEAVNPGATVVVDDKGNATVTMPDGSTATISKEQLVKNAEEAKAKNGGNNLDFDLSKVTVADLANITPEEKAKFQFKVLGAITDVPEFDLDAFLKETDDNGNTVYTSKDGKVKITIDKDGNATATVEKDGKTEAAVKIDKDGNVTIVTKEGQVLAIPRDDAFKQRPYVPSNGGSNNSGNDNGNGTSGNNGATNTDAKADKAKLEGAIHQLDELIIKESAKLDAETAKEATDLLTDAKKVLADPKASQDEVDAMVKRIEDFMAKVAPSTDPTSPAKDQAAQTSAVAPATAQAANANQAAANARKAAKELPNTGTADSTVAMVAATASALLGLGLAGRRRKEDEEA